MRANLNARWRLGDRIPRDADFRARLNLDAGKPELRGLDRNLFLREARRGAHRRRTAAASTPPSATTTSRAGTAPDGADERRVERHARKRRPLRPVIADQALGGTLDGGLREQIGPDSRQRGELGIAPAPRTPVRRPRRRGHRRRPARRAPPARGSAPVGTSRGALRRHSPPARRAVDSGGCRRHPRDASARSRGARGRRRANASATSTCRRAAMTGEVCAARRRSPSAAELQPPTASRRPPGRAPDRRPYRVARTGRRRCRRKTPGSAAEWSSPRTRARRRA